MSDAIDLVDAQSGSAIFTTQQIADKFGVAIDTVRLMRRIHGCYRNFRPVKVNNRLFWSPISENQTLKG
ncbi:MAG: hypothetical protein LBH14_01685 [Desulfobulbaceae bacterium]|jgi:hypothetical protein|nr:hypothetical protein [Desulfobulbaceae bacterium]